MKSSRLAGVILLAGVAGLGAVAAGRPEAAPTVAPARAEGAYTVDAVHSSVIYRIKHLNVSNSYGRFNDISGSFHFDAAKPEASVLDVSVQTESIDSANEKRDGHLKSQDFFSAKEFPTIAFKGKTFKKTTDTTFDVEGDLSLHGVTKPVTVKVELTGSGPGMRGGEVAGIEARFSIKRSDFGMNYMVGKGLSDEVDLIVSLEGGRK
jgi:polyisoprenoid-binding protein YceI